MLNSKILIIEDFRIYIYTYKRYLKQDRKYNWEIIESKSAEEASAFEEEMAEILASGCDDVIAKPFKEKDIFEKIAQCLEVSYVYVE